VIIPDIIGNDDALAIAIHNGRAMNDTKTPEIKLALYLDIIRFKEIYYIIDKKTE
jgi:hypothetical protein